MPTMMPLQEEDQGVTGKQTAHHGLIHTTILSDLNGVKTEITSETKLEKLIICGN